MLPTLQLLMVDTVIIIGFQCIRKNVGDICVMCMYMCVISTVTLKRKCRHFDEILITGCTGSCHFDNFQCSQWWKFHQNEDISVSVNEYDLQMWLTGAHTAFSIVMECTWWWRHPMEAVSALRALCEGNPPVTIGFPSQRTSNAGFDAFFDIILNKRLNKQSIRQWFETSVCSLWRHCNVGGVIKPWWV